MKRQFAGLLVVALFPILFSSMGWAQPSKEASIAVSGSESVRVQPTLLRLEVQLHAGGATAEKAVAQLKTRRNAAIAKLKELKAEEGSIHFANTALTRNNNSGIMPGLPTITPTPAWGPAPANGPPMIPLIPEVPQGAPEPAPLNPFPSTAFTGNSAPGEAIQPAIEVVPPTVAPSYPTPAASESGVTAATTLRAQWRLTTSDPDGIALAGESLRAKLAAAHVFGEENPWCVDSNVVPNYLPPGVIGSTYFRVVKDGFALSFVGKLSDEQRKTAMAAAMAEARRRAKELAEIAGGRIGDLCSVSSHISNGATFEPPLSPSSVIITGPQASHSEVVSQSPDLPEFTVEVSLAYRLLGKTATNP